MWSFIAIRIGKQGTGIFILRLLAKFTGLIPRSHLHGLKVTWIVASRNEERHVPSEENPVDLLSRGIWSSALQDRSFVEWSYNLLRLQWMAPLTTITNEIIRASIFILTTQRFP